MIHLRSNLRAGDRALVHALHRRAYSDQGPRFSGAAMDGFERHLVQAIADADLGVATASRLWIAETDSGEPVGCIAMIDRGARVQLRWFCVVPEARGQAVGRALMTQPKVLMLDEPTAGVSPIVMDELFDRIIEVARTGISILMVEQNARQALEIADRGYVLVQGANAHTGTGKELLADPEVRQSFLGG